MRRITRYVVAEFLKIFCVALTLITSVMMLGVVATEAIREGLAPASVLRLLPYVVPVALLHAMSDADFARVIVHPDSGRNPLDRFAHLYGWHSNHHLAHITSLREREGW